MRSYIRLLLTIYLLMLFTHVSADSVSSWGYQLQDVDIDELKNSEYDWLVIDYSKEGDDESAFTSDEIDTIRSGLTGRKVLSYLSIGEAEDYRFYWQESWKTSPPSWLDEENPDWRGNYKVKYWDDSWQDIIKQYLDRIIDAGFDGVYLDIIDAYEYYTIDNAAELMIDFVSIIANYTRSSDSDFVIIPQNGEEIVNERYLSIVDGIGREEVYVIATNDKRDTDETQYIESFLDKFVDAGKTVLVVDYTDNDDLIQYAQESAENKGYISFVTVVDLDQLGISNSGFLYYPNMLFFLILIPIIRTYIKSRLS